MKKNFIYIAMISLLLFSITFSCKKEMEPTQQITETSVEYTEFELKLARQLTDFKIHLDNPLKSDLTQSVDSARWYLEALFNVENAYTEEPYKISRKDTIFHVMALDGQGNVRSEDVAAMYNIMLQSLSDLEYEIADPNIMPIFGFLSLVENDDDEASFMFIIGFGFYSSFYQPFDTTDNWYFGNMQGKCDGTYQWVSDAGLKLRSKLNNPMIQWSRPGAWVDPEHSSAFYYEYPDVNNENPESNVDYMIYYEEASSLQCLEYDELNFYLSKAHEIFYTYNNQYLPNTNLLGKRPPGKHFIEMDTIWTQSVPGQKYQHNYYMWYGVRVNLPYDR
jgi:hypothetical protein